MAHHQYFPESYIELSKECLEHPRLMALLYDLPVAADFSARLGVIAAYCNILLDDIYTPADMERIAELCIWRLKERKKTIITLN